ncbi:MAG: N-acetyltransferase [Acidobacteria bacterium]|nr:MAG: N-acetyltransferase [Acidobacteriota bacterium]
MATHIPTRVTYELPRAAIASATRAVSSNWKEALPVLKAEGITLRELRVSDAASLLALLTTDEVTRFISPPPTTLEGFERFIRWAHREREAGRYICFAIVPDGYDTAVGLFQVRQLDPLFGTAEWGFALGEAFWGSGLFVSGAELVIEFAFECIGAHRLEARAAVDNGRGNGALRKIGAVQEGILRKSFLRNGRYLDQSLWAILPEDRWRSKAVWG